MMRRDRYVCGARPTGNRASLQIAGTVEAGALHRVAPAVRDRQPRPCWAKSAAFGGSHARRFPMRTSKLWAGASGYAFKEWKGSFYPEKILPDAMLAWYAERLPAVEINNTFYQSPKLAVLEHWAAATPEAFRFAIKAPRRITHEARLKADAAADPLAYLYKTLAALGAKRGPVLFQLPPFLKKDLPRLNEFLHLLPGGHGAVFEFRHDSWFDDDVYAALQSAGASLCLSEREDSAPPPLVETASWGYLRLRLEHYSEDDLAQWARRLAATHWQETHVYFMHEPTAPGYATTLLRLDAALGQGR
jgi:uncharacterized protein YecE (DUF72 family)